MADEIRILSLQDRKSWEAEHREEGLPSQSWRYAWALSASRVEPKLAVVHAGGARMLMVFFEREWNGAIDIATIVGLSGASIVRNSVAPLSAWHRFATSQGWVAGYIQLAIGTDLDPAALSDELVTSNMVFILDLRHVDMYRAASRTIQRKIRNASSSGALIIDDPSLLAARLQVLYPATMHRVGAPAQYHFSGETLRRWALDPESLVLGATVEGSIEAVYLFRVAGRHAQSHILGTTARGRELIAWLIYEGSSRLRERGVTTLNLGGGVRPGDGLYRFKERFNGTPMPLRAVRQIYDPSRYEDLCKRAGVAAEATRWFPAYRSATAEARR